MMEHKLREFTKKDSEGVKGLILAILAKEYPFDKGAYSDSDLDRIGEVYGGEREAFFVIESPDGIAGTVGIKEETREEALLRRLFVDPKHRRRGYGTGLMDKAISFCREKGYKKISFRCTDRMEDAMRLCMSKGFHKAESLEVGGFHIHKLELAI